MIQKCSKRKKGALASENTRILCGNDGKCIVGLIGSTTFVTIEFLHLVTKLLGEC